MVNQPPFGVGQAHYGQVPPGQQPGGDPGYTAYQPYAQPGPGQWPQNGGGQWPQSGGPVPPSTSKKPLLIGLGVAASVVVVILVVALIVFTGGDSSSKPDSTVDSYLHALADGDASEALGLMKAPASDLLLTDEILEQQQKIAKISEIKIIDTSESESMATVQATYLFGDRKADETFMLSKAGDDWRLDDGAVAIDISYFKSGIPGLTAFGVPIDQESKIYVFPGPVEWGTSDKNFTVVDEKKSEFAVSGSSYGSTSSPTVTLSAAGTTNVQAAVQTYLDDCALSKEADAGTDKPGCDQDVYAYDAEPGSAVWTAPTDLGALEYRVGYDDPNLVSVSMDTTWTVTYRTRASGTRPAETKTGTASDFLYGDVDLSEDEPAFIPG